MAMPRCHDDDGRGCCGQMKAGLHTPLHAPSNIHSLHTSLHAPPYIHSLHTPITTQVLPAKGAATAGRGKMLLAAFNNSHGAMGLAAGALMPGGLPGIGWDVGGGGFGECMSCVYSCMSHTHLSHTQNRHGIHYTHHHDIINIHPLHTSGIPPPFPPPLGMRPPFPGWHPSMGPPPFPPPLAFGGHPFGGRGRGRGRGGRGRGRGRGPEGGGVGGVDVGGVGVERVRRDRAQGRVDPY